MLGRELSISRPGWGRLGSRLQQTDPTHGSRSAPFASLGIGPCRVGDEYAFWGPWGLGPLPCGQHRPLRSSLPSDSVSRAASHQQLAAVDPGRRSRQLGRPCVRASRGRSQEWAWSRCRSRPRWSHGGWTSGPFFQGSTQSDHSSERSCDRSEPLPHVCASLWLGGEWVWTQGGLSGGTAQLLLWFCRCHRRHSDSSTGSGSVGHLSVVQLSQACLFVAFFYSGLER